MMNKIFKLFCGCLVLCAMSAVFTSCSDDNDPTYLDEVRVTSSYVAIPQEGGTAEITVTASGEWSFTSQRWIAGKDPPVAAAPQWLSLSTVAGAAGQTTVTFSAESTLDGRTCELLLDCAGKTQRINVIQGLATVSNATCAEIIAGPDSKTYRATGTVKSVANTVYGNWYLMDETGEIYIYGTRDKSGNNGQNNSIAAWGIEVGDEITVEGPKTTYNGTVELVDVTVININKSLIKVDSLSSDDPLPVEGGEVTAFIICKGNGVQVEIPEDAKSWLSITAITAEGITFRAAENSGADRSAMVVFTTTDSNGKLYTAQKEIAQKGVAKGSGTDSDPYNVAAAIGYARSLGADVKSENDVYVKGIISSIKYTFSAQYGTATYNISDDGTENGVFTVYGSYYLGNRAWTEDDEQIKVGDEVIVVGKVIYYGGNTPEFANKESCLFSLNGKMDLTPVSIADFLAAAEDDTRYSITGVVTELYSSDKQGKSFYIRDYSGTTLVYRTEGFIEAGAKAGDVVTVAGKRSSYKDSPQMVSGSMELNFSVKEVSIPEFNAAPDANDVYYMVSGTIDEIANATYGNLYIKDDAGNRLYVYGCYPGWGATGDFRKNLLETAGIAVGDKLTVIGSKTTYKETIEVNGGIYFSHEKAQ